MITGLFLAAALGLSGAQTAPASAPAPTAPVTMTLHAEEDGARVVWRFPQPQRTLRLAAPLSPMRHAVTLDGAAARIVRGAAGCGPDCRFQTAGARLSPGSGPRAVFPMVIEAGECGLWVDLSAVQPIDPVTGANLTLAVTANGQTLAPAGTAPDYIAMRAPERGPVCAATDLIAEDRLSAMLRRSAQDYGRIFGRLEAPPDLILAEGRFGAPGRNGLRGAAVSEDLLIVLAEPGADADRTTLAGLVSHEAAHIWLGRRARFHPDFHEPWIIEGAAEYLSLKQLLRTELAGADVVLDAAARHTGACLAALDRRRLRLSGSDEAGPFAYNCGVLIALYADAAAQAAGSSFEAIAADMVADRAFRAGQATPVDFLRILAAHIGPDAMRALRTNVLEGPDLGKRNRTLALFSAAGLGEESAAPDADPVYLAGVAADRVVSALCPEGAGRWWIDEGVVIELGPACRGPEGTSELTSIEGAKLPVEAGRALLAMDRACAADGTVSFRLGPEDAAAHCSGLEPDWFRGFAMNRDRMLEVLRGAP
ncbi:MAG: hypothetical protein ABL308_05565 [Oceanicaulis sp.]